MNFFNRFEFLIQKLTVSPVYLEIYSNFCFLLKPLIYTFFSISLFYHKLPPFYWKCNKSSATVSVQSPFSNIYFWCWLTWFSSTLCSKVFFRFSRKNIIAQTIPRIQRRYSISLNFCKDWCSAGIFLQNTLLFPPKKNSSH